MCSNTISDPLLTKKNFNSDNACNDTGYTGCSSDNTVVNCDNLAVQAVTIIHNDNWSPENRKKQNFRQRIRSLRAECEDGPLLASAEDLSDTADDSDFIIASRNRRGKKTKSLQKDEVDQDENHNVAHDLSEPETLMARQPVVDQISPQSILKFVNIYFPNMKESEFNHLLQTVKEQNNKSLNGLSCDEIISRIEIIKYKLDNEKGANTTLEHQLNRKPAWCSTSENITKRVLDCTECPICYQPWSENNKIILEECGHCFHSECIRLWMKRKNTCPFCATYSLLLDDFPKLT